MTACATKGAKDTAPGPPPAPATPFAQPAPHPAQQPTQQPAPPVQPCPLTIAADGSYGARLARHPETGGWFPERWTLDGVEPYAVPLPGSRPEEADSEVLPFTDGRVLIMRRVAGHCAFSLLYPTGPGTGELPLGIVESPDPGPAGPPGTTAARDRLTLLPPPPGGTLAYARAATDRSTTIWLVHGGEPEPWRVAEVPGRCTGGAWLDREGRLLALDREQDGRTKTIVVDLQHGGEVSPLLQITDDSNDRLLLADPDSGLLILRSDAPGRDRMGWGVLGSTLPVRFPECLRMDDEALTPFAIQPGQVLMPESCAVALRVDSASGSRLAVWRPTRRTLRQLPAPEGWLTGTGRWTREGELRLPYATEATPCGVARMAVPWEPEPAPAPVAPTFTGPSASVAQSVGQSVAQLPWDSSAASPPSQTRRPVPLQQAPLATPEAQ